MVLVALAAIASSAAGRTTIDFTVTDASSGSQTDEIIMGVSADGVRTVVGVPTFVTSPPTLGFQYSVCDSSSNTCTASLATGSQLEQKLLVRDAGFILFSRGSNSILDVDVQVCPDDACETPTAATSVQVCAGGTNEAVDTITDVILGSSTGFPFISVYCNTGSGSLSPSHRAVLFKCDDAVCTSGSQVSSVSVNPISRVLGSIAPTGEGYAFASLDTTTISNNRDDDPIRVYTCGDATCTGPASGSDIVATYNQTSGNRRFRVQTGIGAPVAAANIAYVVHTGKNSATNPSFPGAVNSSTLAFTVCDDITCSAATTTETSLGVDANGNFNTIFGIFQVPSGTPPIVAVLGAIGGPGTILLRCQGASGAQACSTFKNVVVGAGQQSFQKAAAGSGAGAAAAGNVAVAFSITGESARVEFVVESDFESGINPINGGGGGSGGGGVTSAAGRAAAHGLMIVVGIVVVVVVSVVGGW